MAAAALCGSGRLAAQTGGTIEGTVIGADSAPVPDATVLIRNSSTGERWQTLTRRDGRFFLEHLSVGGPYSVSVRAIGFRPAEQPGLFLSLGQHLGVDVELAPAAVQLEELTVRGIPDSRINAGRTGPAQSISRATLLGLPIAKRQFTNLAVLSPQVTLSPNGLLSFAGLNDRFTSVQVDGTTGNLVREAVGVGIAGLPGSQSDFGHEGLPPEAVAQVQVNVAPFDVRDGSFAGGLIKAVTVSGSNEWHGSLYDYFQNEKLSGHNPDGTREDPFTRHELGLTLGGPIVHDRLAFFVNVGMRSQNFPQPVIGPGSDTTAGRDSAGIGIRYGTAVRLSDILRRVYGVDPGTFAAEAGRVPVRTLFLKLSAQLGVNSRLEVSHSYGHANPEVGGTHAMGLLGFSSSGAADPLEENATRLNWSAASGRWSNEVLLGRQTLRHHCVARTAVPAVEVAADQGVLVAGAQFVCDGADNRESIWDLTDNLGWTSGTHHLTLGMHHELIRLSDDAALRHTPQAADWSFTSLDSLEAGLPDGYLRFLPGPLLTPSGVVAYRATQLGWYVQDQWSPDRRLTLTAGLRLDVPILTTAPTLNSDLRDSLGLNTSRTPSGQPMWSPRLGVNYDVMGHGRTFLRGGIGLFTGRPAYQWFSDAYNGTGLQVLFLQCFGPDVPAFTLDPAGQPGQCGNGELPIPEITVFDPGFRYPRDLRVALGVDQRLPWGLVGTVDLLYVRGVNSFALRDVNLLPASGVSPGEGNRPLYGTFDSLEGPLAARRNGAFGPVIQITNGPNGRSWSAALQLQKDLGDGGQVTVSYTYTDARDYQSVPGNGARANLANSILDGSWEHPTLRTSFYSLPHKVTVGTTVRLPLAFRAGVLYSGTSGYPFTYIALGDPNADGLGQGGGRNNDPVYVPRDAADITLADPAQYAQLDQVIRSNRCLREQRGRLLERNSCRLGWIGRLDVRLTKLLPSVRGQRVELSADMFNLPNFLDSDWGRVYFSGDVFGGRVPLLNLVGYDATNGRGIYEVEDVPHREVDVAATRWRLQLSARYTF